MSGRRPVHLERRGAVYAIRFKIPIALSKRLGLREIRRSLFTKDIDVARKRCLDATIWFNELIKRCEAMPEVTKADIEWRVRDYFKSWTAHVDSFKPDDLDALGVDRWTQRNLLAADISIKQHDDQLRTGRYSTEVNEVIEGLTHDGEHLSEFGKELVARAFRQAMRYWKHRMENPALPFSSDDPFFRLDAIGVPPEDARVHAPMLSFPNERISAATGSPASAPIFPPLREVVSMFLERLERKRVGPSHVDEVGRALSWLQEELGGDTTMDQITTAQIRAFRDNIVRMDASRRGRKTAFNKRLTDVRERQISHATASKYWSAVKGLFDWATSEDQCPDNPAQRLRLDKPKGEEAHSPEAYSKDELIRLYRTPLYAGYRSEGRLLFEGDCHQRGQHWWSGILPLFTGIRAGELTQLLPSDFHFEAQIPFFRIHELDEAGNRSKSVKTRASNRDIPISPILLELGLRQFVERRAKVQRKARVFEKLQVGSRGKVSEGMTRFWGRYLRHFALHKKGRGTHVWRHTVIARLRALGTAEEDIAAFVGHGHGTITSRYGGSYPLERKMLVAKSLIYDFDLVSMLGGPYRHDLHCA